MARSGTTGSERLAEIEWHAELERLYFDAHRLLGAVLKQAEVDARLDEAEIRAIRSKVEREELLAAKLSAWEWMFDEYVGLPGTTEPRAEVSFETVCTVVGRDPDTVRGILIDEAAPPSYSSPPEGLRREYLSIARSDKIWKNRALGGDPAGLDAIAEAPAALPDPPTDPDPS